MNWLQLIIPTDEANADKISDALLEHGAVSVTLQDMQDQPVLEPVPGETPLWPTVQLRGLFEAEADRGRIIEGLEAVPDVQRPGNIRWREVGDRDWERAWMDRFRPMRFGRRLWIVPTGMAIPHDLENIEIRLDPGLAFGTGTHPTTALCLEWLDSRTLNDAKVVDYGCGSGILAIAAALKGAAHVDCVDNDPQALEATAANAGRNGVAGAIRGFDPESFTAQGADIVLANILAGPLIDLAPVISGCARAGGRIVLSGVLEEQVELVVAAYRPVCGTVEIEVLEGWARVVLEKGS